MKHFLFILFMWGVTACCGQKGNGEPKAIPMAYSPPDSLIVIKKLSDLEKNCRLSRAELFVSAARSFIGAPYKAHTLETGENESLVVNLQEFDCTTFVETCLALAITAGEGEKGFAAFCENLLHIRYREKKIDGYLSRLHYFTEWIACNQAKGYISDITREIGGVPYSNPVHFMSNHVSAYQQLAADTALLPPLLQIEKRISSGHYFYLPKEQIGEHLNQLDEGMIAAFTTNIDGLDVIHTGILVRVEENVHLLHASSDAVKVVISENPLIGYISGNRLQTGIIILKVN